MALANTTTTIVNTSGERRYFDFLPPIGGYLDADAEFTFAGSITEWLRRKGAGPAREKMVQCLDYCLDQGYIEIKNGPAPILFDAASGQSMELAVDDGEVTAVTPASIPTTTPAPTTTSGGGG